MDKVKDVALTIAAYIAIPVALFFPVGFFSLWLGFIHYYDFQFSTAWEAASLVDRTMAVGRGANILLIPLIASVLFSWCIGAVFVFWRRRSQRAWSKVWSWVWLGALLFFFIFLFICYIHILHRGEPTLPELYDRVVLGDNKNILANRQCPPSFIKDLELKNAMPLHPWEKIKVPDEDVPILPPDPGTKTIHIGHEFWWKELLPSSIFAVGVFVGGFYIYRNFTKYQDLPRHKRNNENYKYRPRPSFFINGVLDGWISFGLLLTYTISVISVLVLAYFLPVTLPYMWYRIPPETNNPAITFPPKEQRQGTPTYEEAARFLGHSNGYWYAISQPVCRSSYSGGTPYSDEEDVYRSIMAIPDKNAIDVVVLNR